MTDLISGIMGTVCLCGIGYILVKLCAIHKDYDSQEYILLTKEQYDYMKNNPDVKKIVFEQPQIYQQPQIYEQPQINTPLLQELPSYSERAPPLLKI